MVRAQKRGMGKMRERTARPKRQKYRRTRKQIFRGSSWGGGGCSGPCGPAPVLTSAEAEQPPLSTMSHEGWARGRREGRGKEEGRRRGEGIRMGVQHL